LTKSRNFSAQPDLRGRDFTAFAGVERPEEMRQVTRAHLIAWL
jgi:hypothetical protein